MRATTVPKVVSMWHSCTRQLRAKELAHQLLAPPVQRPLEVALTHLMGFVR